MYKQNKKIIPVIIDFGKSEYVNATKVQLDKTRKTRISKQSQTYSTRSTYVWVHCVKSIVKYYHSILHC